jgi:hypothetical protein
MATTNPPRPATLRTLALTGAFLLSWTGAILLHASSHPVTAPAMSVATVTVPRANRPPAVGDATNDSHAGHGQSVRNVCRPWSSRQVRQSPLFGSDGNVGSQAHAGDARAYLLQTTASLRFNDLPRANRAEVVGLGP